MSERFRARRLSPSGDSSSETRSAGYKNKDAGTNPLIPASPAEPLNATTPRKESLSPPRNVEGDSANGGPIVLGLDYGAFFDGVAVCTQEGCVYSANIELPTRIFERMQKRQQFRRARRGRGWRRATKFDNRRKPEGWIAPSQKAKVDFRLKVIRILADRFGVTRFAVEDVQPPSTPRQSFSTVEVGKTRLYQELRAMGELKLYHSATVTSKRESYGLAKTGDKSERVPTAHATDAIAMAADMAGLTSVTVPEGRFYVWKRLHYPRRQLAVRVEGREPRRYGGPLPAGIGLAKGDIVLWKKTGKRMRVGGWMQTPAGIRISLHTFDLANTRVTRYARLEDCVRLYNQRWIEERIEP